MHRSQFNSLPSSHLMMSIIICMMLTPSIYASMSSPRHTPPSLTAARTVRMNILQFDNQKNPQSSIDIIRNLRLHEIRGGSDNNDGSYSFVDASQNQSNQQPPTTQTMSNPNIPLEENNYAAFPADTDPTYEYRETVEDRINAWRRQQQEEQESRTAADAASPVDNEGRFKLFTTVSRVSVSFFFFILMWRTVHHYELADATFGTRSGSPKLGVGAGLLRVIVVTPLVVLFLGEMMGAILGLSGGSFGGGASNSSHLMKKRLKGILNLHKGVELVMLAYNVFRLAIWPSKYVVKEVYVGRTISNAFFLMQAQLYTKLSWDNVSEIKLGEGGSVTESYYDDYTQDMMYEEDDSATWQTPTNESGYYEQANEQFSESHQQFQQQQQQQQGGYQQKYNENTPGASH